jgi:outer membrane autotransporter protein
VPPDPPVPVPPPPPGAAPGTVVIPLIRPEVAVHSVVPEIARRLGLITLGTFHERQGEQALLAGDVAPAAWGRLFGEHTRQDFARGVRPDFDGTFAGLQAGRDLWRFETTDGVRDHIGIYLAYARARGDVRGFAIGVEDAPAGTVDLRGTSLGGYWTRIGPSGGYLDVVLQGSLVEGSPRSDRGISANILGFGFAASAEGGWPIPLAPWLTLEPQAQAIWQHLSLDHTRDAFSSIAFDRSDVLTARIGARLQATVRGAGTFWQPYLKGNVWWNSAGSDAVTFATDVIATRRNAGPALEGGVGINGRLTPSVSVYADASYVASIRGEHLVTVKANGGLRVTW